MADHLSRLTASLRAGHGRAEIGPQEKNETAWQTNYSSVNFIAHSYINWLRVPSARNALL